MHITHLWESLLCSKYPIVYYHSQINQALIFTHSFLLATKMLKKFLFLHFFGTQTLFRIQSITTCWNYCFDRNPKHKVSRGSNLRFVLNLLSQSFPFDPLRITTPLSVMYSLGSTLISLAAFYLISFWFLFQVNKCRCFPSSALDSYSCFMITFLSHGWSNPF